MVKVNAKQRDGTQFEIIQEQFSAKSSLLRQDRITQSRYHVFDDPHRGCTGLSFIA
jgi:hypothetical protein